MYRYNEFRAKLIRCVDGDTAEFMVDCGFNIRHKIMARLINVNTPERGKPDYKKATLMLYNLIAVQTDEGGWVSIKTHSTGKYGRWLVEIDEVNSVLAEVWPY